MKPTPTHLSSDCLILFFSVGNVIGWLFSEARQAVPLDSLITVGYATGNIKNLSGSVEKITELQMNRDQILNPLVLFADVFPDLPYKKEQTARPLWMPSACAERPRLPVATILWLL